MKQMHILGIGNSYMDDSLWNIVPLLKDKYDDIDIAIIYYGGCSIDAHLDNLNNGRSIYEIHRNTGNGWNIEYNKSIYDAIKLDNWNHILFIQGTGDGISDHGYIDSYHNLSTLVDRIKKLNNDDNTKYYLIESWPDKDGNMRDYETKRHKTSKQMFMSIENVINKYIIPNNIVDDVIPVGKMIQNLKEKVDYNLLYRDSNHLSLDIGRDKASSTVLNIIENSNNTKK